MTGLFRSVCTVSISLALTIPIAAATLVAPPTVRAPGQDSLSPVTNLGTPGIFWLVPIVQWDQTAAVEVEVSVLSLQGDPGVPMPHTVVMTLSNSTPDDWVGFELEVAGPATFSDPVSMPVTINRPADTPVVEPAKIDIHGLSWSPGGFATVSFGLDVVPPVASEPVVLTLRPIAVPEPSSGLLIAMGAMFLQRRRRRHS